MAGFGAIPTPSRSAEDAAIRGARVRAPGTGAEPFREAARKPALAATGRPDKDRRREVDEGSPDKVGEKAVDRLRRVGKFEEQRLADGGDIRRRGERHVATYDVLVASHEFPQFAVHQLSFGEIADADGAFRRDGGWPLCLV